MKIDLIHETQHKISENDVSSQEIIKDIKSDENNVLDMSNLLIIASDYGRLALVKYLIEDKKADLAVNDNLPIKMACMSMKFETVDYLKEIGAEVSQEVENRYRAKLKKRQKLEFNTKYIN